jgi:hypothetical protein
MSNQEIFNTLDLETVNKVLDQTLEQSTQSERSFDAIQKFLSNYQSDLEHVDKPNQKETSMQYESFYRITNLV